MYNAYDPEKARNQIEIMTLNNFEVERVIYLKLWEETDWSPDGNTLALSRGKTYQDIVLLKGFR